MQIGEFTGSIGHGTAPLVVLFCPGKAPFGKEEWEPFLVDQALEKLSATYVDPSLQDMTYSVLHADETPPAAIVEEARTLPFLAERRVIVVRNAERYSAMSGEHGSPLLPLVEYIEDPSDSTLLVFVSGQIDRRKRFYKACEKKGLIVESPQLDDRALGDWLRGEARRRGKTIGAKAATELLDRAGSRLSDISNALHLVANYAGEASEITEADVIAACADVAEESIWVLTDAIAVSNTKKALDALHQLLALSKAPEEIIGTVNWLLENAYRALPETQAVCAKSFVEKKVAPMAKTLGLVKLKSAMALCTRTQFSLRETGTDRTLALEMLVIKLSSGGANRRRNVPAA